MGIEVIWKIAILTMNYLDPPHVTEMIFYQMMNDCAGGNIFESTYFRAVRLHSREGITIDLSNSYENIGRKETVKHLLSIIEMAYIYRVKFCEALY